MKKFLFVAGFAGALLAGCSSSDVETTYEKEVLQYRDIPVTFGTFLGNSAETRAGEAGSINDLAALKTANKGFGVFAYYHDNTSYSATSEVNFMYNEKVTWADGTGWTYSPLKYWPNEFQTTGNGYSTNIDKLSFLAYAPWEGTDGANTHLNAGTKTGEDSEVGILGFGNAAWSVTNNEVTGDVYVKYQTAKNPKNSVDLLYADNGSIIYNASSAPKGLREMTKPTTDSKVKFEFKHALARLELAIRYESDGTNNTDDNSTKNITDSETKIKLNSLTIKGDKLGETGLLNLATGAWSDVAASGTYELAVNPTNQNININGTANNQYVAKTYQTVMGNDQYFMFIPNGSTEFTVVADYTVTTTDLALKDKKSEINNVITNKVTFTPTAGNAYKLKLAIGMVSVKLDADVTGWPTTPTDAGPVWLPVNTANP